MGWIFSLQLYFRLLMKKIIIVKGGLGNQFFQYSFSKYIESKFPNDKIYLDFSNYSHKKNDDIFKPRILDYNVKLKKFSIQNKSIMYLFNLLFSNKYLYFLISLFSSNIIFQRKIDAISLKKIKVLEFLTDIGKIYGIQII